MRRLVAPFLILLLSMAVLRSAPASYCLMGDAHSKQCSMADHKACGKARCSLDHQAQSHEGHGQHASHTATKSCKDNIRCSGHGSSSPANLAADDTAAISAVTVIASTDDLGTKPLITPAIYPDQPHTPPERPPAIA